MTNGIESGRILLALTGMAPEFWIDELHKAAPGRPVTLAPDGEVDPSIHYAIVWKQPPGLLARLPNLKVIFSLGAGVDHVFGDPDLPDVPIVRVISENLTTRMSEYVVWQVLDHHRLGPRYRAQQADRVWHEDRDQKAAADITVASWVWVNWAAMPPQSFASWALTFPDGRGRRSRWKVLPAMQAMTGSARSWHPPISSWCCFHSRRTRTRSSIAICSKR